MLYNNSNTFQKRFVTGRFTLIILLVGATLLWFIGVSGRFAIGEAPPPFFSFSLPVWICGALSFGVYMITAFILNSFVIIEGRTPWLGGLFIWLAACSIVLHCNLTVALSEFIAVLLLALLVGCYPRENVQKWVYMAFLFLTLAALLIPQYVYLLPLFFVYIAMTGALSIRTILAALLGVATPLWFLYCLSVVFPEATLLGNSFISGINSALQLTFAVPEQPFLVSMAVEIIVFLSAAVVFAGSTSPAKPLMRRMLLFVICASICLWILSWFANDSVEFLLAWRLLGFAVSAAYIFSLRYNKLFNIAFWIFNIMCIAVAAMFSVWIWIF